MSLEADRDLEFRLERLQQQANSDDESEVERLRREALRIQAKRLRKFMEGLLDAMRKAETRRTIDLDTGEVMRPYWGPGQRFALLVEHSTGCASHWHTAADGFTCTCSPEIAVRLL